MFWNYLKIGYRSILKHKKSSLINSLGLGIAFSVCLVLFSFLDRTLNMDKLHINSDRKYLIEHVIEDDGRQRIFGDTPFALAAAIVEDIPQIKSAVRMNYSSGNLRYDDKVFNERVIFADEGFFDMFKVDLLSGSKNILHQKDKIAISKNIAKKYFGDDGALGKQVSIVFSVDGKEYKENYMVGAVADEFDYMTTIRFDILIPFSNRSNLGYFDDSDWVNKANATFIELQSPDQVEAVVEQLNGYTAIQNEANHHQQITHFLLDPLPRQALDAHGKENMITYNAPMFARIFFTVIAVFILLLAVCNYVNISMVSATSRLKEIGLRKTIGGKRTQLIVQFLAENTILCLIALIFGYFLTIGFTLPGFNSVASASRPLILDFTNQRLWIYIAILFFTVSVGSAAYPAFFISGFRPIQILRGELKISSKDYFAKTLMVIQFMIAFVTISTSVAFVLNDRYMQKQDWGYDKEQTIIVPLVKNEQFPDLKSTFSQNADIKFISGSSNHMGYWTEEVAIDYNNEQLLSKRIRAGFQYLDVMGIRLKEGRFFEVNSMTDMAESIVVNDAFARQFKLDSPIGTRIHVGERAYYIIGVTEDFHYLNFRKEIKPIFFQLADEGEFNFLAIRALPGRAVQTEEYVQNSWKKMYPDSSYEGFFQNSVFDRYFMENKSISNLMVGIAAMAILIANMGLFGLVSLYISKRMKEFSIRKVMGASVKELSYQVAKGFVWVILIASVLGAPLAFLMSNSLITSMYSYHIDDHAAPIILSVVILFTAVLFTVSSQILKAIRVNPAMQLRDE